MSTRKKELTSAKQKRATSPSKTKGSPLGRTVPSYLKPTAASSSTTTDASKAQPVKKKPSVTTDNKANVERRSFNKHLSPSRTSKSPASPNHTIRSSSFSGKIGNDPGPNKPGVARRQSFDKPQSPSRTTRSSASSSPMVRSSSFSGKTGTTLTKGAKDAGKQHSLHARTVSNVKKSSVGTKKIEHEKKRDANPPEKIENVEAQNVPEPEPQLDEHKSFAVEEGEFGYSLLGDEDLANIIEKIEEDFLGNDAVIESPTAVEQHDDVIESPRVTEQHVDAIESPTVVENQEDEIETVEHSSDLEHKEEISNEQEGVKNETRDNTDQTDDTEESGAGDPNEDKRDEGDQHEEANDSKNQVEEKHVQEMVVLEGKIEEAEEATPRVSHGKKDLTLSNDVIEETRNKLTEQRKNKVRALAGAFETVISLQDK